MEILCFLFELFGSLDGSSGDDTLTNIIVFVIYLISLVLMLIGIICHMNKLFEISFISSLVCFILFIGTV